MSLFQSFDTPRCLVALDHMCETCIFVKKTRLDGDLVEHDRYQSHTYTVDIYSQDTFAFTRIRVYKLNRPYIFIRYFRTLNNICEMRVYSFTSRRHTSRSHVAENALGTPRAVELIYQNKKVKKNQVQ